MIKKRIFFHPQRFFLDNVPKQPDGTCYVLNAEYGELWAAYGEQEQENERLRAVLERINLLACFASEEDTDQQPAALLEIGKLARGEPSPLDRFMPPSHEPGACLWQRDYPDNEFFFTTSCGQEGVNKETSYVFCPYCSKRLTTQEPNALKSPPAHTTEEDFQHFMGYSNLKVDEAALRWAFYAGKGEPPPQKSSEQHASDCAVNNAPALPVGPCNCGAKKSSERCICPGDYILKECPAQHPAEGAIVQPWPWPMCNGCGNEPNACTCDSERT